MSERDTKRNSELCGSAKRLAGVTIGFIEIPELACPVFERARCQYPIFVLDRLPNLLSKARQRNRRRVSINLCVSLPLFAQSLVLAADGFSPCGNFWRERLVALGVSAQQRRQLRDCGCGIGDDATVCVKETLIVHCPSRDVDITKPDVDPLAFLLREADQLTRRAGQFGSRTLPVAHVEAQHHIGVTKNIFGHAEIQRVTSREAQTHIEIEHRRTKRLRERNERVKRVGIAPRVFGENHRMLCARQHVGGARQCRTIRSDRRGHRLKASGRHRHGLLKLLFLQPRVVTHVNRATRLSHHHRVGARKRIGHTLDVRRLVVPLGVIAHRLTLRLSGMNPVDSRSPLTFIHRPRRADDEDRGAVDVRVIHRKISVQKTNQIVQNRHHRFSARLRVAMRDLHCCFLVLTQHHGRLVAAVIDNRIVQTAITRARIQGRIRQLIAVQQIDNDVGCVALLRLLRRRGDVRLVEATDFAGLTHVTASNLPRPSWRRTFPD